MDKLTKLRGENEKEKEDADKVWTGDVKRVFFSKIHSHEKCKTIKKKFMYMHAQCIPRDMTLYSNTQTIIQIDTL